MAPDRAHDTQRVVPRAKMARRAVDGGHVDARKSKAGAHGFDEQLGFVLVAIAARVTRLENLTPHRAIAGLRIPHRDPNDRADCGTRERVREAAPERHRSACTLARSDYDV